MNDAARAADGRAKTTQELVAGIVEARLRHEPLPPAEIVRLVRELTAAFDGSAPAAATPAPRADAPTPARAKAKRKAPDKPAPRHDWMPEGTFGPQRPPEHPAVPIEESYGPDFVVCLEDGRRMHMLKRHLKRTYGMSAEQYRRKWGLPDDHPLASESYRNQRSRIARDLGFQPGAPRPAA